jgi:transketolase
VPDFTPDNFKFIVGKGQEFKQGNDVTIISTGHLTWEALVAAEKLKKKKINARVINMHTIKPIDKNIIIKAAQETEAIVTAEEHQIIGGLGSAVAEVVTNNYPVPVEFIGMNDSFGESGSPDELLIKYKMKAENIIDAVKKVLKRKNTFAKK